MKSLIILNVLLVALLLVSCSKNDNSKAELDYASIPVLEVNKELIISESEDFFITHLTGLLVTEDNDILVTQYNVNSIYQFDESGKYVAQIAGEGKGPGELSKYANPNFNGKILLMSNNHGMFTEFQKNEEGIFEYTTDYLFRLPGRIRGIGNDDELSKIYVSVDSVDYPFREIPPEYTTEFYKQIYISNDSMEVSESKVSLQSHSPYIEVTDGGNSMTYESLPYRYNDYIKPIEGNRFLVSRPSSSLIQILDENFDQEYQLELKVKDRFVTDEDVKFHFPDKKPTQINKYLKLVKDVKPPFMDVFLDEKNRFWLNTDQTSNGVEFVVLDYNGDPLGRVLLPTSSEVHEIKNGRIYALQTSPTSEIHVWSVKL